MFDGNLRTQVDRGLTPIGRSLVKTGITPDVITVIGILMSGIAAVTIGAGYLRVGFLFLLLTAIPVGGGGEVGGTGGGSMPHSIETLEGPSSAVSKAIFATKHSYCSIFQALQ